MKDNQSELASMGIIFLATQDCIEEPKKLECEGSALVRELKHLIDSCYHLSM